MDSSEVVPEKKDRHVSYSQFAMWLNCPLQWKLRYIDKIKKDDQSVSLIFGTAMHNTVQEWLHKRFENARSAARVLLDDELKDHLVVEFKKATVLDANQNKVFPCTKEQLQEHYDDGVAILKHVQKYAEDVFPTKNMELIGCEVACEFEVRPGVQFIAYLDIVFRDTTKNKYYILDLKTSTKGWDYEKRDFKKIAQLLLYKRELAVKYNVPIDDVIVKFVILKRKLPENATFLNRRVVEFEPPSGALAVQKLTTAWDKFVNTCFEDDGTPKPNQIASPSKSACRFCLYKDMPDSCAFAHTEK